MANVETNTPRALNHRIHEKTVRSLSRSLAGGTPAIAKRLDELEREWDVERALEITASTLSLTGIGLALGLGKRWLVLSGVVAGFLIQHAIQGWCPPLPIVRALGFRTRREIDVERNALKAARGDFDALDVARSAGPNTLLTVADF